MKKFENNVFSFDAETNGLYWEAFSLAAVVYDSKWDLLKTFLARSPIKWDVDQWVETNVLPEMEGIEETHASYEAMLKDFAEFYKQWKNGADIVFHMGMPVESTVLKDMVEKGEIGIFDGPYPPKDLVWYLDMVGEDPTSVDGYAKKYNLEITDYGTSHNPLYDSEVAAKVYLDLMKRREKIIEQSV